MGNPETDALEWVEWMERIMVDKSTVESVLALTKRILRRNGARITGTASCLRAAEELAEQFKAHCHRVNKERFFQHPDSLWLMGKLTTVSFLLIAILLNIGDVFVIPACLLSLGMLAYVGIRHFACGTLFDGLFQKAEGMNVVATLEPHKEAKQQILIVSHHDSAHEFGFLSRHKKFAGIRLLLAMMAYLFIAVLSTLASISLLFAAQWQLMTLVRIATLTGALFLLPLYWFISRKASPGAGDNLISCTISAQLCKLFANRSLDGKPLCHTRLIFLCADGEEIGQRGSIYYTKKHKGELTSIHTTVVNLDSLYTLRDLRSWLCRSYQEIPVWRRRHGCSGVCQGGLGCGLHCCHADVAFLRTAGLPHDGGHL